MNPIKLIRKLGKALRGGATFRDMFLGIFLGFAIGMVPGVNLTLIFLILLVLFLNATGALAGLSFVLGKILCLLLAPVTFHLGYMMIHDWGMGGLVRSASDTPILALMDLQVYCLFGAIPLIIVIGGLLAWFVSRSVVKTRSAIASAAGRSEKAQKVAGNTFVRFLMRIVFGKQKRKMADMADSKSPLIRKGRVVAAMVVLAILEVAGWAFLNSLVKQGLEKSIAAVNGEEVNIAKADLSLRSGRLVIEGLQVTDADHPTHNLFQAEKIVMDVDIAAILTRRLVMDLVECEAMRMDTERETPGEVYRKVEAEKKPPFDLGDLAGKWDKRAEYYAQIKKFNERLQKLKDYLKSDDPKAQQDEDAEALGRRARAMGYLKMSAKNILAKNPTWVIRDVRVSRIELYQDLPTFMVEGKDLSSHPSLHSEKMTLSASPDAEALKAFLAKSLGGKDKTGGLLDGILGGKKDEKSDDKKKKPGVLDNLLGK
ncbi:MAG: hypothetical protein K8R91_02800 [Phycisphaerae bacterium]|nr:hypothetical protein [Phycisphaerae bacterium]